MLGHRPGHRARASQGRLRPLRILTLAVTAVALSVGAGGFAYFLPAVQEAIDATSQVVVVPSPTPSPTGVPSVKPTPRAPGTFTVLLLGSDNDSKFLGDHVLGPGGVVPQKDPLLASRREHDEGVRRALGRGLAVPMHGAVQNLRFP